MFRTLINSSRSERFWLETLAQDIRIALRLLRRAPSVTAIALLSIALSVGETAVVFTAIKASLGTRSAPHRRGRRRPVSRRLGLLERTQEIIRRTRTLQSVGIYRNAVFDIGGGSAPPEALYGLRMTANLFPILGVSPMIGRNILPEEDQLGHADEMILSYGLWTRRFNADRNIVGQIRTDPGFEANRILASVVLPERERYKTLEQRGRVYRRFLDAVRSIPRVESAGTVDALPFSGENHGDGEADLCQLHTGESEQLETRRWRCVLRSPCGS
jgi:hypothetical protein